MNLKEVIKVTGKGYVTVRDLNYSVDTYGMVDPMAIRRDGKETSSLIQLWPHRRYCKGINDLDLNTWTQYPITRGVVRKRIERSEFKSFPMCDGYVRRDGKRRVCVRGLLRTIGS